MSAKSRNPILLATAVVLAAASSWSAAQESATAPDGGDSASASAQASNIRIAKTVARRRVVARWGWRVCPLVSGLSQEEGEFILGRVSDIARASGVPLAGEHCTANLYILVSPDPEALLKGMEQRNRTFTFGYQPPPPAAIDAFVETPRTVRVWFDTYPQTAWGLPVGRRFALTSDIPYVVQGPVSEMTLKSMVNNVIYRAFVIVDRTSLKGVSLGQLADYVAMAGLVQMKPGTHLDEAPTVLNLFEPKGATLPGGMTDWDRDFLRVLYGIPGEARPPAVTAAAGGIEH